MVLQLHLAKRLPHVCPDRDAIDVGDCSLTVGALGVCLSIGRIGRVSGRIAVASMFDASELGLLIDREIDK